MAINILDPIAGGLLMTLFLSYILGIVHGITPDEHTWPITFSYAIGSGSTKKGAEAGLVFSLGFTIERAVMSEVMFFIFAYGLTSFKDFISSSLFFGLVYIVVGAVMYIAGRYVKYGEYYPHIELDKILNRKLKRTYRNEETDFYKKDVKMSMAIIHGLIAGFGFGAFALIIYFIFAPSMPGPAFGFLPGLIFGLGTMTAQFAFGALFGTWIRRVKKIGIKGLKFVARYISATVLLYGGLVFAVTGVFVIFFPQILSFGIVTPIQVENLSNLGIGFFIVIAIVCGLGIVAYIKAIRIATEKFGKKPKRS